MEGVTSSQNLESCFVLVLSCSWWNLEDLKICTDIPKPGIVLIILTYLMPVGFLSHSLLSLLCHYIPNASLEVFFYFPWDIPT